MPQVLGEGNCQYSVINTAGTSTLNSGPASGVQSQCSVFFGMVAIAQGITWAFTVLDVLPPALPGGTSAGTNTLLNGTATAANQQFAPGPVGVGVRYRGSLVVVTTGTPGAYNALWD